MKIATHRQRLIFYCESARYPQPYALQDHHMSLAIVLHLFFFLAKIHQKFFKSSSKVLQKFFKSSSKVLQKF
ncbi:hypothetical protein, partial [Aeromonas jandaei]|uniref:hypothetical protein n=1 Tax=Aeromonas jandaei TaxID=650 RepID=UPI003B9EBEA3